MGLQMLSFIVIVIKKIMEHHKEKNRVQNINVNLGGNQHAFNTSKYNKPILSGLNITALLLIAVISLVIHSQRNMHNKYPMMFWYIYHPILHGILFPLVILFTNRNMLNFMFNAIRNFLNLQNPPHLVHD